MSDAETEADRAYAEAERLIAEAKADKPAALEVGDGRALASDGKALLVSSGTEILDLSTRNLRALRALPPKISELSHLERLDLSGTQVSDLSALSGLTSLTELDLDRTQVSDLSALTGLTSLTGLGLTGTQVSDLSALWGLTSLTGLSLTGTQVSDLSALSGLTSLTGLSLTGTPVSDLSALAGLTSLTRLNLNATQVSDLRPLRGLQRLVEAPNFFGLTFQDCAAARADSEIARISEIDDASERARTLFAYLEDWVPPGAGATLSDAVSGLAGAYARVSPSRARRPARQALRPMAAAAARLGTGQIKAVLKDSYPDLARRSAHLLLLVQQQRAAHALIPRPNEAEALAEYEAEEEFLKTMEAGLVSLHEDLPEQPLDEISDETAQALKARLVEVARLTDQAIRYLDADRGTYGGLYKIGLIATIGSLLALIPGVNFAVGAALPTAILGAQTWRLEVSRAKDTDKAS